MCAPTLRLHVTSLIAALTLLAAPMMPGNVAHAAPREVTVPPAAQQARAALVQAVPRSPVTVDADLITYDGARQIVLAQGNVRLAMGPFRVTADAAQYDLRTDVATATGRVRVLDPGQGRELRGRTLTYNVRTEQGVMEAVEGIVDPKQRVYVRGARLEFAPGRLIGHDSLVTTCDPRQPLISTTARRVEIYPNQEVIAEDASVQIGGRRVYTTPRLRISLRPEDGGIPFPGFGSNATDGFWIDARFRVRAPQTRGEVHVKYGFQSGAFAYLTLTREVPAYAATLRLGRTQTADTRAAFDLLPYDVAEIEVLSPRLRLGASPLTLQFGGAAGWLRERNTGLSATRLEARMTFESARFSVAPRLTAGARGGFRLSQYGTGDTRTIASFAADLTYGIDAYTSVTAAYSYVGIRGPQPFRIDNVEPASTLSLSATRVVPDHYRATLGVSHNTELRETKYYASAAYVVRRNLELGVSAIYNTRLSAFEDIDYAVRWICDCVDIILRFRQVRSEISLEVGLLDFGPSRALLPRSPRPAPTLPPQDGASERSP